jgi:hypothetical protein
MTSFIRVPVLVAVCVTVWDRALQPRGDRGGTTTKNDRANQQAIAYLVQTAIIRSQYV